VGKTIAICVNFLRDVSCQKLLNLPVFHGVIQNITLAQFFETQCIYANCSECEVRRKALLITSSQQYTRFNL